MKRFISLILAATIMLSCASAAFSDISGHWAENALMQANEQGLLYGEGGKMNPDGLLTRAQLAAILARAFDASHEADLSVYTDVPADAWYSSDMAKAVGMGALAGSGDKLLPNDPVTREQTFTVLSRALLMEDGDASALKSFSDASQVSDWAVGALSAMAAKGYIGGSGGKLNPSAPITRAEFAALLSKLFKLIHSNGTLSTGITGNVLVNRSGTTLDYCTIEGDLIIADGVDAVTLNAVSVYGKIIVRGGAESVTMGGSTTATDGITVQNRHAQAKLISTSSMATSSVTLLTPAVLGGSFTRVSACGDVHIGEGRIQRLDADKDGMRITTDIGGIVSYLYINQSNITVEGTGFSSVIIADGVTGTTLNGNPLISSVVQSTTGIY